MTISSFSQLQRALVGANKNKTRNRARNKRARASRRANRRKK